MSVTRQREDGEKLVLPRSMPLPDALREYAGDDPDRLKWIAALQLHAHGWTFGLLAKVFGHHRGHVCRQCERVLRDLREKAAA